MRERPAALNRWSLFQRPHSPACVVCRRNGRLSELPGFLYWFWDRVSWRDASDAYLARYSSVGGAAGRAALCSLIRPSDELVVGGRGPRATGASLDRLPSVPGLPCTASCPELDIVAA